MSKAVTNLEYDIIPSTETPLLVSVEIRSPRAATVLRALVAAADVCARVTIPTISGGRQVVELSKTVETFRWICRSLFVRCETQGKGTQHQTAAQLSGP